MGSGFIRGGILVLGGLMVLGGLVGIAVGGTSVIAAVWGVVVGLVLIVVALLERSRYRSSQAELSSEAPGPGGGEPTDRPMEARFRRTDERFIDPTTGTSMRVWIDSDSGERRYRAEN